MPQQAGLFGVANALPEGFIYQPEFISPSEEGALLEGIAALTLEEAKYREYTARRRVAYFGFDYDFSANRLGEAAPIPPFLYPLREKMARWMGLDPAAFVHALVSEYRPGTPLGWHRDAPDFDRVAGVSLGGWARMRLRPYPPAKERPLALELEPRSAYQMNGAARWRWQHSIPATRELRYSITFRTLSE
ncbi:MAG TPA: alpha-ketoglutarate-dependent dioxygenase AlkB [Burkholderiales bacterium]|nr:alpha-ketoglutarate-dependent dioxygenase AlkB [Burkholderiales bacterium]